MGGSSIDSKNQSIKILEHFSTKLFAAKLREKT